MSKIEELERTLGKLDVQTDYTAVIELVMLIIAHYINAAMHKRNTVQSGGDIKHNRMEGVLKREKKMGDESEELARAVRRLEDLRPGYAYGRRTNGTFAEEAMELYQKVKEICGRTLDD